MLIYVYLLSRSALGCLFTSFKEWIKSRAKTTFEIVAQNFSLKLQKSSDRLPLCVW